MIMPQYVIYAQLGHIWQILKMLNLTLTENASWTHNYTQTKRSIWAGNIIYIQENTD